MIACILGWEIDAWGRCLGPGNFTTTQGYEMHIFGIGVLSFRQSWLEASVRNWISKVYDD